MKSNTKIAFVAIVLCLVFLPESLSAFCGFYVAKADASLYNQASRVVLMRAGDRTTITMENDYQGDLTEFAMLIPVPTLVKRSDIRVVERSAIDHIDAYTAPRLVEYFDPSPCPRYRSGGYGGGGDECSPLSPGSGGGGRSKSFDAAREGDIYGVEIEAEYSVGEYDIQVLSATFSAGLIAWLKNNEYKLPTGAEDILQAYIKRDMKFFVAKVNLERQSSSGFSRLSPLQVSFHSDKFMLPIRLGTLNAKGPQDLLIFVLSPNGRVESSNYRTVNIPSNSNVPLFVKDEFGPFYKAMFSHSVEREGMRTIQTEYSWSRAVKCDPCTTDPPPPDVIAALGNFGDGGRNAINPNTLHITRLHVRYTAETFPEDIMLTETRDRSTFQGRYVIRHAWDGEIKECEEARSYFRRLRDRHEDEAENLARLTGWNVNNIKAKMRGTVAGIEMEDEDRGFWGSVKSWFGID